VRGTWKSVSDNTCVAVHNTAQGDTRQKFRRLAGVRHSGIVSLLVIPVAKGQQHYTPFTAKLYTGMTQPLNVQN
jgi:hypothetical protein